METYLANLAVTLTVAGVCAFPTLAFKYLEHYRQIARPTAMAAYCVMVACFGFWFGCEFAVRQLKGIELGEAGERLHSIANGAMVFTAVIGASVLWMTLFQDVATRRLNDAHRDALDKKPKDEA